MGDGGRGGDGEGGNGVASRRLDTQCSCNLLLGLRGVKVRVVTSLISCDLGLTHVVSAGGVGRGLLGVCVGVGKGCESAGARMVSRCWASW